MQDKIDLFNKVLGAESFLVEGQGVRVSIFGEWSKIFLVNVCNCLKAKDFRGAFGQIYQQERLWPRQKGVKLWGRFKFPFKVRRGRDNTFILVNNIVADFSDHYNRFYFSY